MDFVYEEVLDLWVAECELWGKRVDVRLYCQDDDDFAALATKVLSDIETHRAQLEFALIDKLLPMCAAHREQQITADELLSRLILAAVDFDTIDIMYTLIWSDSGLFGGHAIILNWDPEADFKAEVSIAG